MDLVEILATIERFGMILEVIVIAIKMDQKGVENNHFLD